LNFLKFQTSKVIANEESDNLAISILLNNIYLSKLQELLILLLIERGDPDDTVHKINVPGDCIHFNN
jgi:hypothetical protein